MEFAEGIDTKNEYCLRRLTVDSEDGTEFIDKWETNELLFLASSVLKSDRNWVSVARSMRPFGEQTRPSDWSTPKNCALQYTKLLSEVADDSKNKTLPRTERETSEVMLVKNLTEKRLKELEVQIQQVKAITNGTQAYIDMVDNGDFDENIDEILEKLEEEEKRQEESFREYLTIRETLNASKKLNKSRVIKKSKAKDNRKKMSPDKSDEHKKVEEVIKNIKKEIDSDESSTTPTKSTAMDTEKIKKSPITLNALLDSKVTTPSSATPTSPYLTSLLRSITSSTPTTPTTSSVTSALRGFDTGEGASKPDDELIVKSQVTPPRSVPHSSCSNTVSSPLLNSLLKNTPSSTTPIQVSAEKEISPKIVSSTQSFFNPTSALATAAAQQLAVATSTSQGFQFLKQHEVTESHKISLQSSPTTSACLSAPTLSKLLEMPPSTPGRLPPLPVPDPPVASAAISCPPSTPESSVTKTSPIQMKESLKKSTSDPSVKKTVAESSILTDSSLLHKSLTSYSHADKKSITHPFSEDFKTTFSFEKSLTKNVVEDNSQEKMSISEASCEKANNQAFEKEIEKIAPNGADTIQQISTAQSENQIARKTETAVSQGEISSSDVKDDFSTLQQEVKMEVSYDKAKSTEELSTSSVPSKAEFPSDEDDAKSDKSSDSKSSVSKTTKSLEKGAIPKTTDKSKDETPTIARRSGRRGKKGRGRAVKDTPKKIDQYEFVENPEESSVDSQAPNTLCYMPRVKDSSRFEDSKKKLKTAQETEGACSVPSLSAEKKPVTPIHSKQEVNVLLSNVKKHLFKTDEEKKQDDAFDQLLKEDKLKKSEESQEKKEDTSKSSPETAKATPKEMESGKKKTLPSKRNIAGKELPRSSDSKASTSSDDSSKGSKASDVSAASKNIFEEKDPVSSVSVDMEVEISDSHQSSSMEADSDKQLDEIEGFESLQGSVVTEISSTSTNDVKEEKEISQSGKQDWGHIVSPKSSSEAVSLSSEESEEDESDNWDNQSVSTNKSTSQSTIAQTRPKRKERETPQYKAWKKAIGIVLREASCHKNANIFMQKVTDDVAPGYSSIVHRPMDLSLIKKNIDNGVIRTTDEFHRDMLLMFQNAIMYNSSDHDVHLMAVEMQRDVIQQISAFLTTQSNDKDETAEPVSSLRKGRKSHKGLAKPGTSSASKAKEETD